MKLYSLFGISILLLLSSCNFLSDNDPITSKIDYDQYLLPKKGNIQLSKVDTEITFWKKRFEKAPDDLIARNKIASLYMQRFSYSGNVAEVHSADSLYQLVNQLNRNNSSGTFRSLAANCITQHKFLQAEMYIDSALHLGDDKFSTVLMEFDVAMELGKTYRARKALSSIADKNAFEYLIREAKYKDHAEGDLSAAILLMERALKIAKDLNNQTLLLWTLSNLGDMYGHANRFKESYRNYLQVLAIDPEYYHALKGIAWLAYSKDGNIKEAKRILHYLQNNHPVPDYDLMLSEIAATENNQQEKNEYQQKFISKISNRSYGDMYNKYLFTLQADELNNSSVAMRIAENEVKHRPTGEAYSWLAWAYCKNGQNKMALETLRHFVLNKCFEPNAMYHIGKIYMANKDFRNARTYFEKAIESRYELGPNISNDIDSILKAI